jgi:hypothetical protein
MNKLALYALVALAPLLCAATVASGHLYGQYNDGIYTAPAKLFRISAPFPDEPIVSDGREPENNNAGAVSFIDSAGRLLGVLYMESKGPTTGGSANPEVAKVLGSWFRDTGFPGFFRVSVPDAKILREAPGEIGGQPAWIAVAYLPRSSPLGLAVRNTEEVIRNDSWRGMAIVARGKRYYLLQTELRIEKLAGPNWQYDADAADWNVFVPELEALYDRIEFLKP